MARLNAVLNAVAIGFVLIAGVFIGTRPISKTGSTGPDLPSDSWFQSAVIDSSRPVVVKFGASWCGPCRMLDPELDQLGHNGQIKIVRVDLDKHRDLARHYRVSSIPHVFLFERGAVVADRVGYADHEQLRQWVRRYASL